MGRYQTDSFTTSSVAGGATLPVHRTSLPNYINIVKVKVTPDSLGGSFDYKIFKKDDLIDANLLAAWDNVTTLYDPTDRSSGVPVEVEEGPPIPYTDEDETNELHLQIINNDTSAHTYTVTIIYEEVPLLSAAGTMTLRGGLVLGTSPIINSTTSRLEQINGTTIATWSIPDATNFAPFFGITATLPAVHTNAGRVGVSFNITSAGSGEKAQTAAQINLLGGYTGNNTTTGLSVDNSAESTTCGWMGDNGPTYGNVGISALATGNTVLGSNTGLTAFAKDALLLNIALAAYAGFTQGGGEGYSEIGVGIVSNAFQHQKNLPGVFAILSPTLGITMFDAYTQAALVADNGASGSDIFAGYANSVKSFAFDSSGRLGIGSSAAASPSSKVHIYGDSNTTATVLFEREQDSSASFTLTFAKKRSGGAIVQSGDFTGLVQFQGWDGAAYRNTATITSTVAGTPGSSDMPGSLVFATTPDGASLPVTRMTIAPTGDVTFTGSILGATISGASNTLSNIANASLSNSTITIQGSAISLGGSALATNSTPTFAGIASLSALALTPAAGSNLNINLATTGDFAVNTNQFYVDTSTGRVSIGASDFDSPLHIANGSAGSITALSSTILTLESSHTTQNVLTFLSPASVTLQGLLFGRPGANARGAVVFNHVTDELSLGYGATANTLFGPTATTVTLDSLTGSSAVSALSIAQTWNTSGNPTMFLLNLTNTASGSASLLEDFKVGGSSVWNVSKAGAVTAVSTIRSNTGFNVNGTAGLASFSGPVTELTIVGGIVTAAS